MATQLQRSRKIAFARQGGTCYYCGLRIWLKGQSGPSPLRCTAEHLKPRSAGGGDEPSNIVAACLHCNSTRHKRKRPPEPERYRTEVRRRVERGAWLPRPILAWGRTVSKPI
ncbi:HNH endonuclease [Aquabacterium sp.]|uniref:HNH endonuclease n=1 Tax=Aquabacterium sp. TaxID=1872578 RepID=UPI0040383A9E